MENQLFSGKFTNVEHRDKPSDNNDMPPICRLKAGQPAANRRIQRAAMRDRWGL